MQKVKNDIVVGVIAYVAGLLVLLLWPDRQSALQAVVFSVGMLTLLLVMVLLNGLAFKRWPAFRRPRFDLLAVVTQTRPSSPTGRPSRARYSVPNAVALFLALTIPTWLRGNRPDPDWALTGYVIGIPLLLAGFIASELLWAIDSRSGSSDVPAR